MTMPIIIAIDGFSACGKSTLAKALAKEMGYLFLDSGAMYRAVTLYFLDNNLDWNDAAQVEAALQHINIDFSRENNQTNTLLNGEDVEAQIREMRVSQAVSPVATISAIRRFLVAQQQALGHNKGIVMDGRDIGTVVFPDAELKIFLTASQEARVGRRLLEIQQKGGATSPEEVAQNLQDRDYIDSHRDDSPLRQAPDAVLLDNTNLSPREQLLMVAALAKAREEQA